MTEDNLSAIFGALFILLTLFTGVIIGTVL